MSDTVVTVDPAMLSLFINDTQAILSRLEEQASESEHDDIENYYQQVAQALESITSGARLCRIPFLPDYITSTLSRFSSVSVTDADNTVSNDLDESVTLLKHMLSIDSDELISWLEDKLVEQSKISDNSTNKKPSSSSKSTSNNITTDKQNHTQKIDPGLYDLFFHEVDTQTGVIAAQLLKIEDINPSNEHLETLMRAAHSLKGAARMLNLDNIVTLAHKMEDGFVKCQSGQITMTAGAIDLLLQANDLLKFMGSAAYINDPAMSKEHQQLIDFIINQLEAFASGQDFKCADPRQLISLIDEHTQQHAQDSVKKKQPKHQNARGFVRLNSTRLNKILGLSNELMVSQHWLSQHHDSLQLLKKRQTELNSIFQHLKLHLEDSEISDDIYAMMLDAETRLDNCRKHLGHDIGRLEDFDRKHYNITSTLNQQVLQSRMRPFAHCASGFHRLARDMANQLGKQIKLEIHGEDTLMDSDILDKIEAPLTHMLRNAIDHGIEVPDLRVQSGKSQQGNISIHALHSAGFLNIVIKDDGKGIDIEELRRLIVSRGHVNDSMSNQLTEKELLDFLYLPGFSTRAEVTEYSGRGVGLDVVHSALTEMRGQIMTHNEPGLGMTVTLQLPLTLSVARTMLTEISSELYAFPLSRIHSVNSIYIDTIYCIDDKQIIDLDGHKVSLVNARQLLDLSSADNYNDNEIHIVILRNGNDYYGIVVDTLIGEAELAVRSIDPRIGKIRNISAAAVSENGRPVLVIDIDDIYLSLTNLISHDGLSHIDRKTTAAETHKVKSVLVVDDSLTVREVERQLLESYGYHVSIAVDGIDGWNNIIASNYDLVISDIDMPRMNGFELVEKIKHDKQYQNIPVMIVSYKDNPEDRKAGLRVGADYYLTKGSFHDDTLIDAVIDLIGEAYS